MWLNPPLKGAWRTPKVSGHETSMRRVYYWWGGRKRVSINLKMAARSHSIHASTSGRIQYRKSCPVARILMATKSGEPSFPVQDQTSQESIYNSISVGSGARNDGILTFTAVVLIARVFNISLRTPLTWGSPDLRLTSKRSELNMFVCRPT